MTDNNNKSEMQVALMEHLLCNNGVRILVSPSAHGVVLPAHLMDEERVCLEYDLDAVVPIDDIEVTDEGIRATLSFSRAPFATFIPWAAVLGMGPMREARVEKPAGKSTLRSV
jgi:hypothetical protein